MFLVVVIRGRASVSPLFINPHVIAIRPPFRSRFAPQAEPGRDGLYDKVYRGDHTLNCAFRHVLPPTAR